MAEEQGKSPVTVSKWVYPFPGRNDSKAGATKPKEITDPNAYFSVLANAEDGFYPVGANGLWHGGIHFDGSTAGELTQSQGVRCLADGEVIAYRIDSAYPEVEFEKGKCAYSRGFVLVKHRLQLPPVPKKTAPAGAMPVQPRAGSPASAPASTAGAGAKTPGSASAPAPALEEPSLIFHSLYMHLLDWSGYRADDKLPRPNFWGDECKRIVGDKAPSLNPYAVPATKGKGVNVRQAGKGTAQIGWLPPGTALTLEPGNGLWRKIASVEVGRMEADPRHRAGAATPLGWVHQGELSPAPGEPRVKDGVCVLDKPIAIKAGDLIGHLGQYQRHADAGSIIAKGDRPLVHIEVFSAEDVQAFIGKSRDRAQQLEAGKKTLLVVSPGTKLVVPATPDHDVPAGDDLQLTSDSPAEGDWAKVTRITVAPAAPSARNKHPKPTITATGNPFWIDRTQLGTNGRRQSTSSATKGWNDFPLQPANAHGAKANHLRVAAVRTLQHVAMDDKGVRWWKVDVDEADATGGTSGWVCERGNLQSPWDWPGFEIVEESAVKPADLHGKKVIDHKLETPDDKDNFEAKADRAKEGALFQKLYDVLDTDKDEKLSTAELRAALRKPWLAQTLSRLIVRYESEWGGSMGKWDALDSHMREFADEWAKEKGRIKDLQWWSEVAGKHGFPASPAVYHFHCVGMVGNFWGNCSQECLGDIYEFQTAQGNFRISSETFEFILATERYQEFPYVPTGGGSGVTIGYGYDLGQQKEATVRADLAGIYSKEQIDSLVTVIGKVRGDAANVLSNVSTIYISNENVLALAMRMKERYAKMTAAAYPQVIKLHPHCQGALLSLVVNRGTSFKDSTLDKRLEMKQIGDDLQKGNPEKVPERLRSMKRLWENTGQDGLIKRRYKEAEFFEKGLECDCSD